MPLPNYLTTEQKTRLAKLEALKKGVRISDKTNTLRGSIAKLLQQKYTPSRIRVEIKTNVRMIASVAEELQEMKGDGCF